MSNSNKKIIQMAWLLTTLISLTIGASLANAEEFSVQVGVQAEWEIKSVSNQPVAWYRIDVWTFLGNWKAENNSKMEYKVTEANENIYGDLIIGNLTVTNSSSAEIASNTVLGILSSLEILYKENSHLF